MGNPTPFLKDTGNLRKEGFVVNRKKVIFALLIVLLSIVVIIAGYFALVKKIPAMYVIVLAAIDMCLLSFYLNINK